MESVPCRLSGCAQPVLIVKLPCGVAIDEQHFLSLLRKPYPEIQAGCGFTYAAFLVAEGSNCCFHFLILLLGMQKAQPFQAALSRLYCYRFKAIHISVIYFH